MAETTDRSYPEKYFIDRHKYNGPFCNRRGKGETS
jgi:hypothetical protein